MRRVKVFSFVLATLLIFDLAGALEDEKTSKPFLKQELIFPWDRLHNHSSCIVECPNGDLLVCWYRGSGERKADDVLVLGARKRKGQAEWSEPFVMADTPGYPDTNPAMFIDPQKRLWLLWNTILDNRWESALLKYRITSDYERPGGPPNWDVNEVLHVTPSADFESKVAAALDQFAPPRADELSREKFEAWIAENRQRTTNKLSTRLGWMTRVHPYVLDNRRLIVPLYSDGFDFSIMAITDDWGKNWFTSEPLVGMGNVQPSLVQKKDGTLMAFMRDNGPPPQRIPVSQSTDRGMTWSRVTDSDRVDSGAGVEALVLKSGLWLLTHNDLEDGRHRLAVSLSDDEGRTWKWTRYLERDSEADIQAGPGMYHYPSVIQSHDGTLHMSYSIRRKKSDSESNASGNRSDESIKHAHFNVAWIMDGN